MRVANTSGAQKLLRLLDFTSYDPLQSGLEMPAVKLLASWVGAQLGVAKDETR